MARPTDLELHSALTEAGKMRELGEDPHCVAKALLSLNYRLNIMEDVLQKTRFYLRSGHGAREHTRLLLAIDKIQEANRGLGEQPRQAS